MDTLSAIECRDQTCKTRCCDRGRLRNVLKHMIERVSDRLWYISTTNAHFLDVKAQAGLVEPLVRFLGPQIPSLFPIQPRPQIEAVRVQI